MEIRMATVADAEEMLEIYTPYVRDTAISMEYEVPTAAEFRARVRDFSAQYPYLVCLCGGRIVGYAYAHAYLQRAAYQWDVELSVYLEAAACGQGLGSRLTKTLTELLRLQHVRTAYALITSENRASLHMTEQLGFRFVGEYRRTAFKHGRWHGVSICELPLCDDDSAPEKLLPFPMADRAAAEEILRRF